MKCVICNGYHLIGESCKKDDDLSILSFVPKYEPPKLNLDPILPKYEPPSYDFPKYEPPKLNLDPILPRYEPPLPPPPMQVRDIGNNLIGYKDSMSNQIQPANSMINGGLPLKIEGNFVRDTMGNLFGQMGPGNTMFPPPSFGPPDPDPGF